ncbi:hypothetical protein HYALB_00003452 [Hymenoscyphus albidus]|uniref:Signal recognition particle subunit SRP68 n=1 Tax=Hymenoscyphus albidus TaxID=595503 RepID=A0A9N9Q0V7_9HELO|nr:hypothetical protein HYALB_00003452 [Hymenoscyphus albidus]
MDITNFVVSGRDNAKLYGDYASYRKQLSNRIHNLRKKLGLATKPRAKYTSKAPVTTQDIAGNQEYVHLILLTAERAWANAMSMREIHSTETKGITGSTRSHIISRLHKASTHAKILFDILLDQETTKATDRDVLEARAYVASLVGATEFEKQGWEACLRSYSEARIIYSALSTATKSEIFKDLLSNPIDVSIRYGAYQMRMPRTVAVPSIARKFFPTENAKLLAQVEKLDPDVLKEHATKSQAEDTESEMVPKTITWRSRTVNLEDAAISTALISVKTAVEKLSETLASASAAQAKDKAAAYDDVLIFSQDAVDATKHAIDELVGEGVGQGDKRMQSLQITRTAVSYDMVSWRIGRNRVLVGGQDGADNSPGAHKSGKEEGTGKRLARYRERAVLYDGILQSLDSIKALPGVAADGGFTEEIEAKANYFSALKCLNIARSHALLSNLRNALALVARASEKANLAQEHISSSMDISSDSPPNISVSASEAQFLDNLLKGEVQRYRGLVELSNVTGTDDKTKDNSYAQPLVERLHEYPSKGIDLSNLVTYPPKLEPVPVKPLFFDAAWNYIDYPGREVEKAPVSGTQAASPVGAGAEETTQQKKGWFGFGR